MPTGRHGRGPGHGGRHGRGRGRLSVAVQPRDPLAEDERSQTHAPGERMVRPGPSPPRAVSSGRAEHDPYRNQPSRGGAGGRTGPPPSRPGVEPVPCQDHVALPPSAQPAVSYLEKLLGNTTLKESSVAATSSPILVREPPDGCQEHVALPPSAQPAVSYLDKLLGNTTLKESSVAATSSPILVRKPPDWYFTFYIRMDLQGFYHTYPDVCGPFKTLQEADNAINRHLHDLEDPKMSSESLDKLSPMERAVRESLYWPDGTRQNCLEPPEESHDETHILVEALVDQYNEDHNLMGDRALQLKDVQRERFFISKGNKYFHYNFTARTEGGVDSFFAEVQRTQGEHREMVVSCFCVVKPNDNGRCYGCQNNGAVDMKHPNKADAYCHGRVDEYMPCMGGYHIDQSYLAESIEDEERRLRCQYECLDDPKFMAEHFPNCVKGTVKT